MKKIFLLSLLTSSSVFAETWECLGMVGRYDAYLDAGDAVASVITKSKPNAQVPRLAAIKAIDPALNEKSETQNICATFKTKSIFDLVSCYGQIIMHGFFIGNFKTTSWSKLKKNTRRKSLPKISISISTNSSWTRNIFKTTMPLEIRLLAVIIAAESYSAAP